VGAVQNGLWLDLLLNCRYEISRQPTRFLLSTAGIAMAGFLIALIFFFICFLRLKAGASWVRTFILTAAAAGGITALARFMVLDFPRGLLQNIVDLPWPIG